MIKDMMDVHNAFMAAIEDTVVVDGNTVPVRFFNKQPKEKDTPEYPEIIVSVFAASPFNQPVMGDIVKVVTDTDVEIMKPLVCRQIRSCHDDVRSGFLVVLGVRASAVDRDQR